MAKTQKCMACPGNQAKLHSFRYKPTHMCGFLVPQNHAQAMEMDRQTGNTKWFDSEIAKLTQIDDYNTFIDKGKGHQPGPEHKKIRVHVVCTTKRDDRHKSYLIAGGHLTKMPIDSAHSSVVSLRRIRILTFFAKLNDMETWTTVIGHVHLESFTQEKVHMVAGPEFW